ncbi:hypothetical protein CRM79_17495 [Pantoea agglomerans]|uniref:HalD/BesD family halogenase n=1 Tax=Pantoea vagans TaxID=470934 RepID=UPI000BF0E0FE|nr:MULTISPECIES: hypothetical protein [Pantoea]MDE8557413.1 hypothetical protein [Pantoea vagans]MDE8577827.1 hypothetical protein [Pantoea vagans]PEI05791.1 hypothetical protein CRM79_17495 [Pantoea agglomerans]
MEQIETQISQHINGLPESLINYFKNDYEDDLMVVIEDLLPLDLQKKMEDEARSLLERNALRREVIIKQSGNTPRAYDSVGRNAIREEGKYIPAFFDSPSVLKFLSRITGEELYRVPYEPEEFIINSQNRSGDTHGWHWDDYSYALVWVIDEPDVLSGARVEFIPRIPWKKENTREWIKKTLAEYPVISRHVARGQCYLLRARDALHRIAPLTQESRRTVIVFTYANELDFNDASLTHDSMEEIYPQDTAQ